MTSMSKRTYLREVNPHLTCPLCRGYLIDATTVVECLHSFCRSCILQHLRKDAKCPSCKLLLNTAKPNIKADKALQDIVYKLVPGLYHKEMRRRRDFYGKHPEHGFAASLDRLAGADSATPEQRGEDVSGRLIFAPEDAISLSLEYLPTGADPLVLLASNNAEAELAGCGSAAHGKPNKQINGTSAASRRYLQCPALVTIAHLKKFLALKYSVDVTRYNIDICHRRAPLPEHWTLMDVAYIFAWKRNAPIRFFYRVTQEEQQLEAPPNDRPSTPGLGASQPATNDESPAQPVQPVRPEDKPAPRDAETDKAKAHEAKRALPDKELKVTAEKLPAKPEESAKQVKSPIKIMKKSDGNYQVLRPSGPPSSTAANAAAAARPEKKSTPPASPTAEFSVVSINDSNDSKQVKITLKQCQPAGSKKPKVISNVLLSKSSDKSAGSIVSQLQDMHKQEKHKRKVSFDVEPTAKQPRRLSEQTEKKQFLHAVSLTAKGACEKPREQAAEDANSVEAQLRDIIRNKLNRDASGQLSPSASPSASPSKDEAKRRPSEAKNTNIADRLGEKPSKPSAAKEQQPIDVYAFPGDPPSASLPPGAVKRKCPPGLPIFKLGSKHQQYASGKRGGLGATKGSVVKCYRNQSKPTVFPKPPASPTRPLQSLQTPMTNAANVSANGSSANAAVSSTSSKNKPTLISDDTRSLLDGCGLNIPASLSITLTASKSDARESQLELRKEPSQGSLDKLNPSITLNDKSVDPRVLKALKSGQMRVPMANAKSKGRPSMEPPQQTPAAKKKKKDETPQQPPRNALDLSAQKKMDFNPLKIPTPLGSKQLKAKPPPPTWSQASSPKPSKDESGGFAGGGQVVTLNSGQRFYRAAPGSLTPAVNRFSDAPAPSRTPVYASCFGGPSGGGALSPISSHMFPSLKSLYALNQAPSLEQFSLDSRLRMGKAGGPAQPAGKSHLAAQCAPVKPARSSLGSFAVPAKPAKSALAGKPAPPVSSANDGEAAPASSAEAERKPQPKEAATKADCEPSENCASCSEEAGPAQGSASPRVTSTVSPSPPPSSGESGVPTEKPSEPKSSAGQASSEVSSTNGSGKSPESPDSSSLVSEGSAADSTKQAKGRDAEGAPEAKCGETAREPKAKDAKPDEKGLDPKKPMSSEALQKRFLAAFPSNEWANNPVVAEHFGVFLESLNTMPSEPKKPAAAAATAAAALDKSSI